MKTPIEIAREIAGFDFSQSEEYGCIPIELLTIICEAYAEQFERVERINCAAIWYDDGIDTYVNQPINIHSGYVVCGHRHHNCLTTFAMLVGIREKPLSERQVQGFLTSRNRFVNRREAAKIAFGAGQIEEEKEILYSEDIY